MERDQESASIRIFHTVRQATTSQRQDKDGMATALSRQFLCTYCPDAAGLIAAEGKIYTFAEILNRQPSPLPPCLDNFETY